MDHPPLVSPSSDVLARFAQIVGPANAIFDKTEQAGYLTEWRDRFVGRTPVVLRPGSTEDVSKILALANAERVAIVPQGGNTGLVGGQIPSASDHQVVVSMTRLNAIRQLDRAREYMTCEAGVTLAKAQQAAHDINRLFPLSLASEGSCQIGGNLATNAGGTAVLSYGNARQLAFGLEVVLADGRIISDLKPLKKDNTGYDLTGLFIGSEGTLGIITAATLKLFPKPVRYETAFVAVPNLTSVHDLYLATKDRFASNLTGFEFLPKRAMTYLHRHSKTSQPQLRPDSPSTNSPWPNSPWYVLLEVSHLAPEQSTTSDEAIDDQLASHLAAALDSGLVSDAALANSLAQRNAFWALREQLSEVQKHEGGSIKHDVSVPVHTIPDFIEQADRLVASLCPGARPVPFGHFGDGNIHYNISQPTDADRDAFLSQWEEISRAIHQLVDDCGGSISAEHGIGRLKRSDLKQFKDPVSLDTMRAIKTALDPNGILNPGKVL